jgi:nanoRNase/pAp phosphatase (c-di-AMP/oligoRNAs hydrolase)
MSSNLVTPSNAHHDQANGSGLKAEESPEVNQTSTSDQSNVTQQPINADVSLNQIIEALKQTLDRHRGERQLVIIQDFPDPDALSSAWAYQLIAQKYDIQCEIVYAGILSHQENIALVKLTGLPAKRWGIQTLKERDLSVYQGCVLIDTQGTTSQLMPLVREQELPVVVIIDHHSDQGEAKAEFVDLRNQTRATATILTQYIQAGLLKFNTSNNKHVKLATALMHGLRSDTNRLMQAQEED